MEFKELTLPDKGIFDKFLSLKEHRLSAYHFCNIFIWRKLFRIFYAILDGNLCLFFKDKYSCFMYLPPLGKVPDLGIIDRCFAVMDGFNINSDISRIENIEENDTVLYKKYGYICFTKPGDYICKREDVASATGNRFKSKRASNNHFIKHYNFEFRPFVKEDKGACLDLYLRWAKQRKNRFSDSLYRGMLEDSLLCQGVAMDNFLKLGFVGYVIVIQNRIAGYTLGFPINSRMFCILFEICDLSCKGIAQFIFSQFCRQLPDYQYINIMDDSGLMNLRRVKQSYHPVCVVPNYIIKRN